MRSLRFRILRMLAVFAVCTAGVIFGICATPVEFEQAEEFPLDFLVVDAKTGEPLPGAHLRLVSPWNEPREPIVMGNTGIDGRVRLTPRFQAEGFRSAFSVQGKVKIEENWLEVTHPDYVPETISLTTLTGETVDISRPRKEPYRIALTKGKKPEELLKAIAGYYSHRSVSQHGAPSLKITADGRFGWNTNNGRYAGDSFGYAKVVAGHLILSPVRSQGPEVDKFMAVRYTIFRWGERVYIAIDSDLPRVAQQAVQAVAKGETNPSLLAYLREEDDKKPLIGLPSLPAWVWIRAGMTFTPKEWAQFLVEVGIPTKP